MSRLECRTTKPRAVSWENPRAVRCARKEQQYKEAHRCANAPRSRALGDWATEPLHGWLRPNSPSPLHTAETRSSRTEAAASAEQARETTLGVCLLCTSRATSPHRFRLRLPLRPAPRWDSG